MIVSRRITLIAIMAMALLAAASERTQADPQGKPAAVKSVKRGAAKPGAAKQGSAKPAAAKVQTDTRVYLMRGLLNVFSLGMDTLQERLSAMGFEAEVFNHNGWITIANKIAEDRKRGHQGAVVLIGHSLGADVLFQLTERLDKENIPVRLAIFFDPTISHDISGNVEHVLNLYQHNGFGRKVTAPKGYKGELVNMDLSGDASIGHSTIDKSEKLHDLVVGRIMKVAVGSARRKPERPGSATATPMAASPAAKPPGATAGPVSATPKPDAAPVTVSPSPTAPVTPPVPAVVAPSRAPSPTVPATPPADTGLQVPRI
jgi:hypothetical protein